MGRWPFPPAGERPFNPLWGAAARLEPALQVSARPPAGQQEAAASPLWTAPLSRGSWKIAYLPLHPTQLVFLCQLPGGVGGSNSLEGQQAINKGFPKWEATSPAQRETALAASIPCPFCSLPGHPARQRTLQLLARVQNFPAITCPLPHSPTPEVAPQPETPCNSGCHCPNYTPRSSRQHCAPRAACIMGLF